MIKKQAEDEITFEKKLYMWCVDERSSAGVGSPILESAPLFPAAPRRVKPYWHLAAFYRRSDDLNFTCGEARRSTCPHWPPPSSCNKVTFKIWDRDRNIWNWGHWAHIWGLIWPRGHVEAAMATEATKMIVRCNMHMDTRGNQCCCVWA